MEIGREGRGRREWEGGKGKERWGRRRREREGGKRKVNGKDGIFNKQTTGDPRRSLNIGKSPPPSFRLQQFFLIKF